MDVRNEILARNLVNYSCKLKKGENILIESHGLDGLPLLNLVVKEVYRVGGVPFTRIYSESSDRELLLSATEEQLKLMAEVDCHLMENMQAYIGIRATSNTNELADVSSENMTMYDKFYRHPVHHEIRVDKTKWVVLRDPNASMAQLSGMSVEKFSEFYYEVCNLDYKKMDEAMNPLKELMEKTDKVRITGPGTDISFSIKNIPAIKCAGELNIPDGEIFTAPHKDSVNGTISYNAPSTHNGFTYENVVLKFKDGKIIEATANDSQRINKVFDTDEGARYIGEFAIGVNPYITKPMKDILFDEKIMGSLHFTPGSCYKEASNGNESALHWDLVLMQAKENGGGEIYFDGVLVRKDGIFTLPELMCLNPENLK